MNVFADWAYKHGRAEKPIGDVNKRDMYDFLDWIKESRGVSNSTWNNYRECIKRCMKELVEREIIPSNPCDGIKRLPTKPSRYPFFNDDQQKKLEAWMKAKEPILYRFTRFLYHGFIRPIEVKRIKVNDINLKSRIIMIWSQNNKNKKQQPVIITEGLYKVLVDMEVGKLPGNWYLFGRSMEPGPEPCKTKHKFGKIHRRMLDELKLYDGELQMYDWKHTGVCRAFDAKVDIVSIMHQCRHHSLDQTYTYLRALGRVIQEDLKGKEW
jgi:integrase